jgi:hypothetical protein
LELGLYGNRLGSRFRLDSAPVVTVRALRRSQLAVTEIVNNNPHLTILPIPPEDAFLVHLMMRDCLAHDLYVDNGSVSGHGVLRFECRRWRIAELTSPKLPREGLDTLLCYAAQRRGFLVSSGKQVKSVRIDVDARHAINSRGKHSQWPAAS